MVGHGFLYCTTLNSVELGMVCECAAHLKKKTHYRRQLRRGRVASLKACAATAVLFQIIPASIQMKSRLNHCNFGMRK